MTLDPKVLLIDADPVDRAATRALLESEGIEIVGVAATGEEALELVQEVHPTVALVDAALRGMGAATTVRRLRELSGRLEVVGMASFSEAHLLGELVATGVDAYVVKGKAADIVAAVRAVVAGSGMLSAEASRPVLDEVHRLYERERLRNEELETMVSQLQALSVTDWLTGLKNHGYFFERLNEEMERARRYGRPVSVVIADIDDFKGVNDAFGHTAGDSVLRNIGRIFRTHLREVDIACRMGGEEFGLILPETDVPGAKLAAERLRTAVAEVDLPNVGTVTISLGVAVFPVHAEDRDELVELADRALYQAKRAGKNRTVIAGEARSVLGAAGGIRSAPGPVISAYLNAFKLRAPHLLDRAQRVAEVATTIGMEMGLRPAELERLRLASLLHDVGMIGVPDAILHKAGPLTAADWEVVRRHPEQGYELIVDAVHPEVSEAVLAHHERMNGSGYPRGLSGTSIPLFARIIAVSDAVEAMTSARPFRPQMTEEEAVGELRQHAGSQFDPSVVNVLVKLLHGDVPIGDVVPFPDRATGTA